MVLVLVVTVVGILLLMGFAGSRELNQNLTALRNFHNQRLLVMAANAAIEEVSAVLEAEPAFNKLSMPPVTNVARNIRGQLGFPRTLTPTLARADFERVGVEVGDVTVESSDWVHRVWKFPSQWTLRREIASLTFRVPLKMARSASASQVTSVTARRYVESSPDMGSDVCRLRIHGYNMLFTAQ